MSSITFNHSSCYGIYFYNPPIVVISISICICLTNIFFDHHNRSIWCYCARTKSCYRYCPQICNRKVYVTTIGFCPCTGTNIKCNIHCSYSCGCAFTAHRKISVSATPSYGNVTGKIKICSKRASSR